MKTKNLILIFIFCNCIVFSKDKNLKMIVYCILGQGADHRLFNNFDLGEESEIRFVEYQIPVCVFVVKHYNKTFTSQYFCELLLSQVYQQLDYNL